MLVSEDMKRPSIGYAGGYGEQLFVSSNFKSVAAPAM
jgi:hypothetical protein